jgi:NAD-dependent dihydropyrimidine dehydrogenase PreA subunit
MSVTYVITESCVDVKDKSCIEVCPVDCIYEGARMLYIHPDECVDCSACEPECPVDSIFYQDDLPGEFDEYRQINADFFADLGSPGGAKKIGMTENDPVAVKSLECRPQAT